MKYPVNLPEYAAQRIDVVPGGVLSGPRLLVNDIAAPRAPDGGFLLTRDDGTETRGVFRSRWYDPLPLLAIDGREVSLAPPLAWADIVVALLPFVILVWNGWLGGLMGGAATSLCVTMLRGMPRTIGRYIAIFGVVLASCAAYSVLAGLLARYR